MTTPSWATLRARVVVAVLAIASIGACAHRPRASTPGECTGTEYLFVSNPTGTDLDIYHFKGGNQSLVGTARPGLNELSIASDMRHGTFGARNPSGAAVGTNWGVSRVVIEVRCKRPAP